MSDLLLNPGDTTYNRVDPTLRPTTDMEGKPIAVEEFDPTPADKAKYYVLETLAASMISPTGMRIPFINKLARVDVAEIQRYLDGEIERRTVPHLRHATPEEVEQYHMMMNPRAFIKEQVTTQVMNDPALREAIRMEEEAKARAALLAELDASGEEIPEKLRAIIQLPEQNRPILPSDQGGQVQNKDTAQKALDRLRVGGATIIPTQERFTPQNTSDIKDNSGI